MSGSVTVSYLENCIFELCKLFEGGEKLFMSIDDWDDNGNDCGDDVDGDWDDDGNDVDEAHTDEQWGGAESKNGQSRCNYVDDEMLMVVVVPTFDDSDGDWCDDIYIMVKCLSAKVIICVFKGFGRFSCFQTLSVFKEFGRFSCL